MSVIKAGNLVSDQFEIMLVLENEIKALKKKYPEDEKTFSDMGLLIKLLAVKTSESTKELLKSV